MILSDVKLFLRVDGDDEDTVIQEIIDTAAIMIESYVLNHSEKLLNPKYVKLTNQLSKLLINDLYSKRSMQSESDEKLTFATKSLLSCMKYGGF